MRFDTIIIGGGLSGLVCGLRLQKAGKKCAIVSAGQNAMHFFSGGFGLLSRLPDGKRVSRPLEAVAELPDNHPYSKIGKEKLAEYAEETVKLFGMCGIKVKGDAAENGFIISGSGSLKPAWLDLDDAPFLKSKEENIGSSALIVNIEGFLDMNTSFIADSFEKRGIKCRIVSVSTPELKALRNNPSEMRSSNIAKLMADSAQRAAFMKEVNKCLKDEDLLVLPAVFGLKSDSDVEDIRSKSPVSVIFIGTLTPSVPGIRTQMKLKRAFEEAGGVFLMGDNAVSASIEGDRAVSVTTENLGDILLTADSFVLATGSYFGHGLIAERDGITEPVCGLDVAYSADRSEWYNPDFFKAQNYIGFGVTADEKFRAVKDGKVIGNLYVAGSLLGGFNPLYEGSGSGVAIMTAMSISDSISSR